MVTIGEGNGDSFMVERISPKENTVVVLLRPKGEDCTFRFVVDVGQSVQLRIDTPLGQSFLCETTLRPIVDAQSVQFRAECAERPANQERKWPTTRCLEHSFGTTCRRSSRNKGGKAQCTKLFDL
jgi:hypothetical protein